MSRRRQPAPAPTAELVDVVAAYSDRVAAHALILAQIGTPQAIEAMNALAAAMSQMAQAFNLTAAVIRGELQTQH